MKALKLVFAFLRIPRLSLSLLAFPLFLSICVVYIQLITTGIILASTKVESVDLEKALKEQKKDSFIRKIIFKTKDVPEKIKVCRWSEDDQKKESPLDKEGCRKRWHDISILTDSPLTIDVTPYEKILSGQFVTLHICKAKCKTEISINLKGDMPEVHLYSTWAAALFGYVNLSDEQIALRVKVKEESKKNRDLFGAYYLHATGFQKPTNIDEIRDALVVIANIAVIVLISLWLAVKAHRKVLDYFSYSGALLPLVAACGQSSFYSALWILTLLRVGLFLVASIPLCYGALHKFMDQDIQSLFFGGDIYAFVLWLLALVASLSLAALVASIAELKRHHSLLSFVYKYLPLILSFTGMAQWSLSFLVDTTSMTYLRSILSSLPIVGLGPTLLAPIFTPSYEVLALNTILSVGFILFAIRYNVRWFAAHLEEI